MAQPQFTRFLLQGTEFEKWKGCWRTHLDLVIAGVHTGYRVGGNLESWFSGRFDSERDKQFSIVLHG